MHRREPIAVVGIGCRFPGNIETRAELWEALCNGSDVVTDVPPDRFDIEPLYDSDPRKYGARRVARAAF